MTEDTSHSDRGAQSTTTRRSVLKTAGAGVAATGLTTIGIAGTAAGADINTPKLARDGNRIVDPQGEPVTLQGVSIADAVEASREWRTQTSEEIIDLATSHEDDWYNTVVRIPCHPEFIAAASKNSPEREDLPHGDDWGPALPGYFDESDLGDYFSQKIDPLVQTAQDNGAYVMIDYHRHYPAFHNAEHEDLTEDVDCETWICCDNTSEADGFDQWSDYQDSFRAPDACGQRGVLWHGADQKEAMREHAVEQGTVEAFDIDSADDIWFEPDEVSEALHEELQTFWTHVADRYGDDDNVIYEIYNEPTGPYGGEWGGAERTPADPDANREEAADFRVAREDNEFWMEMWHERSDPWVQTAVDNGGGQLKTIGNPRWSQYVFWAPFYEYDVENMAYTSHVYTQESMHPLAESVGPATEHVPVMFSEFGWQNLELTIPTPWMEGTREDWAPQYEEFIENHPVSPVGWCFDHTYEPPFFEHGDPGPGGSSGATDADVSEWNDYLIEEDTPGAWWQEWLQEMYELEDRKPASGSQYTDGDQTSDPGYCGFPVDEAADVPEEEPLGPRCTGEDDDDDDDDDDEDEPVDCENSQDFGDFEACDSDGDDLYDDFNGDGELTTADVSEFQTNLFTSGVQDNTESFNFAGGDSVSHGDVIALFNQTTGL